jgi:WhiB family transcriptional regulator, redox-sensing transcriptional regulator
VTAAPRLSTAFMGDPERACRGKPGEWFYLERGAGGWQVDRAKRICGRCPVRAACLAWALATAEPHGIWGATTPNERRAILGARPRRGTGRAAGGILGRP